VVDANDNGLADFNGDGVIDASDTIDSIQVWRDLNENAVTDAGELFSLADLASPPSGAGTTQSNLFVNGSQIARPAPSRAPTDDRHGRRHPVPRR